MENVRRTNAELAIRQALFSLMKQQPFGSITVIQIAREADVNRKTFYSYYTSKEDCFYRFARGIFAALFDCFLHAKPASDLADPAALDRDIHRFLREIERHKDHLDTLITEETAALAFASADDVIIEKNGLFFLDEQDPSQRLYKRFHVESVRNTFLILIDVCTSCTGADAQTLCDTIRSFMQQSAADLLGYRF